MAKQEFPIAKPAYAYMGYLNIRKLLYQRKILCTTVLSEFFPALATTWVTTWNDTLKPILFTFGNSSMVNTAMPDKPDTQGDGSLTPWKINKTMGTMSAMYRMLVAAGVTINSATPLEVTSALSMENPKEAGLRRDRWDSILDTAEKIHEIEGTISMILLSIYPCKYASGDITRSPGQLLTVGGEMAMTPAMVSPTGAATGSALTSEFYTGEFMSGIYDLPYDKLLREDVSDVSTGVEVFTSGTISIGSGVTAEFSLAGVTGTLVSVTHIIVTDTKDGSVTVVIPKTIVTATTPYVLGTTLYLPDTAYSVLGCANTPPLTVIVKAYCAVEY